MANLCSLVSFLEELSAQLEMELQRRRQNRDDATIPALLNTDTCSSTSFGTAGEVTSEDSRAAYYIAASASKRSAPANALNISPRHALPYYRILFMSAELPFPLAFRKNRSVNVPSSDGDKSLIQLPEEVSDKLMTVYIERILSQYPLFLEDEMRDMYHRFKQSNSVTRDERFAILMALALATLSSRANDYRKLVSTAEVLRREAFSCVEFDRSCSKVSISTIQKLLLLAQYGYLLPWTTNLWHVVGDAMRIALALGLHETAPTACDIATEAVEFRHRLFLVVSQPT